ncbi:hypothetical protein PO909_029887 [Leuciscus waleckii]
MGGGCCDDSAGAEADADGHPRQRAGGEPAPRNQSSNRDSSGHDGEFQTSPTTSAALFSIADISGSGSGSVAFPEGGNGAESSCPGHSSPSNTAMDILSSGRAPNETTGRSTTEGPARSSGSSTGCSVREEGEIHGDLPEHTWE